ncbi:MAG: O-antigen ligase domain-containing protein [Pseudomonadota bacterium]|nr:O-antigen ligase domain-containing protein [Pseudomonadota bacterium]
MSASAPTAGAARVAFGIWLRRAGPFTLLLAATLVLGLAGQSVARPVFVLGSVAVMWDLLRFGASAHYPASLVLFCLAPILRRVVDVSVGYDPSGLMISGPLLGLMVVVPRLLSRIVDGRRLDQALWPFITAAACVLYATVLTMAGGNLIQAASGTLKWIAPLLYGAWLYEEAGRAPGLIRTAARAAMILAPVLGVYGFLQYVDPPAWDRFWMTYTSIASIGQPLPYMVRVFSTMNAPAGYATFTAAALLLFGFGRARLSLLVAAAPSVLSLMLSTYRTAWIALAIGTVFGLFHRRTVRRAAMLLIAVPLLAAGVVLFSPAGDALSERLGTFSTVSDDASGMERLGEYAELLNTDGGTLIGNGFGNTDVMQAGAMAQDGQFVVSWYSMGLVVGIVNVASVLWLAVLAIQRAWRSDTPEGIAVAGIIAGMVVQMPLAVISASEIGFLFWSLAAIGAALPPARPITRGTA